MSDTIAVLYVILAFGAFAMTLAVVGIALVVGVRAIMGDDDPNGDW